MATESSPTSASQQPSPVKADSLSAPASKSPNASALSRELADFLVEFSIVLHKRSMYPAGHPHLRDSADRFVRRLNALLEGRDSITLGVARHRLVIETVTTDPKNALLRDLAHRLHRHRIASVHLKRGATVDEIDDVLTALSADPQRGDGPIGRRLEQVGPWEHVRLRPVGYDKLTLQDFEAAEGRSADELPKVRDGWVELARLALSSEAGSDAAANADPLVVAQAIKRQSGEVAYDRVVLGYLTKVAEEMSGTTPAEEQLGERLSDLIEALEPETLRRLLETGGDQAERRKFALSASQVLAADAVMEVLEAAAKASHQTISHNLLRLLHKLAHHAEEGAPEIRAEAEGALRTNVAKLIGDWELEDPNPKPYTAVLEGMVRRAPADLSTDTQGGCEPEIILKMALELGSVGPSVREAVDALVSKGELARVASILDHAPRTSATETLWSYLATPERLRAQLTASPVDHDAVAILVGRIGENAADSLLDHLGATDDRSTRAALLKQLLAIGPGIGQLAAARLPEAPWYLQRNILVLLGRLGSWPEGFSPLSYTAHADARIRREAIKLLLEAPNHVAEGIALGLCDADDGIATLALTAALENCAPDAVPLVERIAVDQRRPSEMRVLAIRILARSDTPQSLQVLVGQVLNRRRWFGRKLASKSPELLAAVTGLAIHWKDDPAAFAVLTHALQHSDPDIRAAAITPAQ